MKIFSIDPLRTRALIFDIDQTLYDNRHYYHLQETLIADRLARHVSLPPEAIIDEISHYRESVRGQTGRRPPLGVALQEKYGIAMADLIRWREELFHPEQHLNFDPRLHDVIAGLSENFRLAAVTNNPTNIARRTLKALGVERFFHPVIGADTTLESKPSLTPFLMVLKEFNIAAANAISIGDRYEVDLELPLQCGMGGILIEELDDLYRLPEVLAF